MRKEGPLELSQFIQKYNRRSSVPNILIVLRIFLTIAVSVATYDSSFSKLKLIKNYLRSSMSTLQFRNLAILSIKQQLTDDINFDIVLSLKNFASKKARKVTLQKIVIFISEMKMVLFFTLFLLFFLICHFYFLDNCYL